MTVSLCADACCVDSYKLKNIELLYTQVSEFKSPISLTIIDAPTPSRARQVEGY